jgi:hypothetical protein
MHGKCPKCEKIVSSVSGNPVDVRVGTGVWKGISYQCPLCNTVLGVQIDPVALKTDIVDEIARRLPKK